MRIALVHDWLTGMRGGERVVELLCELYPSADVFTLVHEKGTVSPTIEERRIQTSWLTKLPRATRWYRYYLPLLPLAAESLDLSEYDLVISSSSCVVKGVLTRPDALHVSYVHSPMRYAWDLAPYYFPRRRLAYRLLAPPLLAYLRMWDVTSSARVDRFVANSSFVAARIRKYYRRSATVIHPPVDTRWLAGDAVRGERYLVVSALVPNKGVELVIQAFNELGRPLTVVGEGSQYERLRKLAGPNVEVTGWVSADRLRELYLGCRALVHAAIEDFGIAPLEAAAAGKPTIALGAGGMLDSVVPVDGRERCEESAATGLFFHQRSAPAIAEAVGRFETLEERFDPEALRAHARRFDRAVAARRLASFVDGALRAHRGARTPDESTLAPLAGVERA